MTRMLFVLTLLCSFAAMATTKITGAGATFPYPLYTKWFADYQKKTPNVQFNYQPIGSGGGIRQLTTGTVDFGASDIPMTKDELSKVSEPVLQIPSAIGSVAIVFNIPGVTALKLDGAILAKIYLGTITHWDDKEIVAMNAGTKLPKLAILVSQRADASGTTALFTEFLAVSSAEWMKSVGTGKAVNWPVGTAAKGNDGVSGIVKGMKGSIGYVELAYANQQKLATASLKNKQGEFILPTPETSSLAAQNVKDPLKSLVNSEAKGAYPISAMTYLMVTKSKLIKVPELKAFLQWALTDGQKIAPTLDYAALPSNLLTEMQTKLTEK